MGLGGGEEINKGGLWSVPCLDLREESWFWGFRVFLFVWGGEH